ncbi:hypothetical protein B0H67DRAFT_572391 [Lasiosphaeris hirsuta]|uniref:Uncharacterized protein n=1 Tax=Lasiosphaeris hirsuta TaxID=260670 RepID=A0AA40B1U4_9PEZI|nr:hypothetical protein B0H67DRAFT_572391 [Lasiosphaeris hirsuta]
MGFPTLSALFTGFAILVAHAAPAAESPDTALLDKRVGTDWSLKTYGAGSGTCSNPFTLYQGTATRGCRNLGSTATAINLVTDVDCVITVYSQPDCPRGSGTQYGPNVAQCVSQTSVRSFRVDCGVV